MEVFDRLNALSEDADLSDLFLGVASYEATTKIIDDLNYSLDLILDASSTIDINAPVVNKFLRTSFPFLIELFLRRKSARNHEKAIVSIVIKAARLLAQPAALDIIELCEQRNLLLTGNLSSTLRFISQRQLMGVPSHMLGPLSSSKNIGFLSEYGLPSIAVISGANVAFWPDEWQSVLGGSQAVNHFVRVRLENDDAQWAEGCITSFNPDTAIYEVSVLRLIDGKDDSNSEAPADMVVSVDLTQREHLWVDLLHQQRPIVNSLKLKFAHADVGKFIRVWWSRYQRFYYGRISAFDPTSQLHTIVYEDADSRQYDMNTKEYELIDPPLDILRTTVGGSDANASKVVADWHRSQQVTAPQDSQAKPPIQENSERSHKGGFVARPSAGSSLQTSMYQFDIINAFFAENVLENMYQSLCDQCPAPSCRIILLHLQLIMNLRSFISSKKFRDIAWDFKEAVPLAILRWDAQQLGDFSMKEFNDILYTLRDIISIASQDVKDKKQGDIQESFDILRLSLAQKLMVSPKIQKRYLGLSIIKELIDLLVPKLNSFLARRHQVLKRNPAPTRAVLPAQSFVRCGLSMARFDQWLEQSNIVDMIFGDSLHEDMIAKMDSILVYMAVRRLLSEPHILAIWQTAKGSHEAIARVTFNLLLILTPTLESSLRRYIFGLLSSIQWKDFGEQLLRFAQSFTIECLQADNLKNDDTFTGAMIVTEEKPLGNLPAPVISGRKGLQLVAGSDRQWLGFGLLWQFILDAASDPSIDASLVNLAVKLLVDLLRNEFADERETVMQRCIDNVQIGVAVSMSLLILRQTLNLYPAANKSWFILSRQGVNRGPTLQQQVERLIKQCRLMEVYFGELERLHGQTMKSPIDEKVDLKAKSSKQKQSDAIKLQGIAERLDFLQFVLSKSNYKLTESQALIIWQVFGEDATSEEALDKLCLWLDMLITAEHPHLSLMVQGFVQECDPLHPNLADALAFLNNAANLVSNDNPAKLKSSAAEASGVILEDNVVVRIFEDCILRLAYSPDATRQLSRRPVAALCIKSFLLVNICNKAIKLEADGSWQRVGQLNGTPVLWKLSLDAVDEDIALASTKVLVELHQRLKGAKALEHRSAFLRLCFKHLYFSIQSLTSDEGGNSSTFTDSLQQARPMQNIKQTTAPEPSAVAATRVEDWFEGSDKVHPVETTTRRIARLVADLQAFILRFYYTPSYFISLKLIVGSDESAGVKYHFRSSDTIGAVRKHIANHYKEDPSMIILQVGAGNNAEKLERDDASLEELRFGLSDQLFVRKKDVQSDKSALDLPDRIRVQDLDDSLLDLIDPLKWLQIPTSEDEQGNLFALPALPVHCSLSEIAEQQGGSSTRRLQGTEELVPIIKANPYYIDQLLEMLDGYLSTSTAQAPLSQAVWDILQVLPFQPLIFAQVVAALNESDGTQLKSLLSDSSPYRLLYTLQVLDSLLSPATFRGARALSITPPTFTHVDCAIKLFHLGGVEVVSSLLDRQASHITATESSASSSSSSQPWDMDRRGLSLLISALLLRIMMYLLSVDPLYRIWQCAAMNDSKSIGSVCTTDAVEAMKTNNIPPGLVMSCVDATTLVPQLVDTCVKACLAHESSDMFLSALRSFVEHSIRLCFGLCTARDDGLELFNGTRLIENLFKAAFACDGNDADLQIAICRCCFEGCAAIYVKCADPLLAQDKKPSRMRLYDHVIESVVSIAASDATCRDMPLQSIEALFSLLAAVECVRVCPERAFNGRALFRDPRMSTCAQINALFRCVEEQGGEEGAVPEEANEGMDRRELIKLFALRLANHSSSEAFHSGSTDVVLLGILRILLALSLELENQDFMGGLENAGTNLIDFLYNKCLFTAASPSAAENDSDVALCQTKQSREIVYALLYSLCDNCDKNFDRLARAMVASSPLPSQQVTQPSCSVEDDLEVTMRSRLRSWDYDPTGLIRPTGEYLGLCNQGGTCYMNSFLQQLYHCAAFTDGLLSIAEYSDNDECSAVLFQLQVMFGYLKLSKKRYYDTLPFCRALIDYDGQPLSLTEQKDINEFAGMLFDKLEKNPACADLLKRTIQGTLVWQVRSLETPYKSDREESFFMISAEVKGKSTLLEALDLNVADELFTGDNKIEDSDAGRKVDAVRRCAIRTLPSTLIIHLKRFEFDLETMARKKVNDFLSFPMDLDMFPYTEAGIAMSKDLDIAPDAEGNVDLDSTSEGEGSSRLPRQDCQYVLKGIVAHVGAIDRGHYYSFIKDVATGQWFEFNDRAVLPFNPGNIPRECFGGSEESVNAAGATVMRVRENNAYLLVYERKSSAPGALSLTIRTNPSQSMPLQSPPRSIKVSTISKRVEAAVWKENNEFQQDRFVFDPTHFLFFWKMLGLCEGPYLQIAPSSVSLWLRLTTRFVVDVVVRARAKSCVSLFFDKVEELMLADQTGCLAADLVAEIASFPDGTVGRFRAHPWLLTAFQDCPHALVARAFARILTIAMKTARQHYATSAVPVVPRVMPQGNEEDILRKQIRQSLDVFDAGPFAMLARALHGLLAAIEALSIEDVARREGFKLVCSVLTAVAALGFEEKFVLLRVGAMQRLVCFVIGLSPISGHLPDSAFFPCIELLASLISMSAMPAAVEEANAHQLVLFPEDLQAFLNRVFLEECILMNPQLMTAPLQHLCRSLATKDSQRIVDFVFEKLVDQTSVAGATHLNYRAFFRILSDMLLGAIDDIVSNQNFVAKLAAKAQHLAQRSASNDPEFVYAVCKLLHRIGTATPDGNAAVIRVRDAWKDLAVKLAGLRAAGIGRRPVVTSASSANSSKVSAIQLPPILS